MVDADSRIMTHRRGSVSRAEFEALSEEELTETTNKERVLNFLRVNDDKGWARREIIANTDVPASSVSPSLTQLKNERKVQHKGEYWAAEIPEGRRYEIQYVHYEIEGEIKEIKKVVEVEQPEPGEGVQETLSSTMG